MDSLSKVHDLGYKSFRFISHLCPGTRARAQMPNEKLRIYIPKTALFSGYPFCSSPTAPKQEIEHAERHMKKKLKLNETPDPGSCLI